MSASADGRRDGMRILLGSILKRKVDPEITASRPRIIYELAKGLVKKDHQVSLLGTGDSFIPDVKIIPAIEKAFVDMSGFENVFYAETSYLVQLAKKIEKLAPAFDIVHNHTYPEFINLLVADRIKTPMVTTIHAQVTPELDEVLSLFPETHLIAISNAQRRLFKKTKVERVIYNGVDTNLYAFSKEKGDYLLWLGRLSKAKDKDDSFIDPKGVRWAIRLAQKTGQKLLLSGNVEDRDFFEQEVKPHLNERVQWVGSLSSEQPLTKQEVVELMQKAKAFLMTINWYEPFGLVMAEAMSCGTSVIGFDRGAVGELVIDGKTGFVVAAEKGIEGLVEALSHIDTIDPKDCRRQAVENFSVEKMVDNYEKLYSEIIEREKQNKSR